LGIVLAIVVVISAVIVAGWKNCFEMDEMEAMRSKNVDEFAVAAGLERPLHQLKQYFLGRVVP